MTALPEDEDRTSLEADRADTMLRALAGVDRADRRHTPVELQSFVGQVIGQKYRIDRLLGSGGMGAVFEAEQLNTQKPVALKLMLTTAPDEARRARFVREAQAAGRIQHPNVVDIYDVGFDGELAFLVMERLRGEDLRGRLTRGPLSTREALQLFVPLLRGLSEAHRSGVIHRDLKPENVLLHQAGEGAPVEPRIVDFGISRIVHAAERGPASRLTDTGAFVGTPSYAPLERLRGESEGDVRGDLYAVGVMLYEALTGSLPYEATGFGDLVARISQDDVVPPRQLNPELGAELSRVVLWAMARHAEQRPASAEALIAAFERALSAPETPARRRAWARWTRTVGVLAGVSLTVVALTLLRTRERTPSAAQVTGAISPAPTPVASAAEPNEPAVLAPASPVELPPAQPARVRRTSEKPVASAVDKPIAKGSLTVLVFPYGKVWVDGALRGESPVSLELDVGTHEVTAGQRVPGASKSVVVRKGEHAQVVFDPQ